MKAVIFGQSIKFVWWLKRKQPTTTQVNEQKLRDIINHVYIQRASLMESKVTVHGKSVFMSVSNKSL
jgi:hypothetical protein